MCVNVAGLTFWTSFGILSSVGICYILVDISSEIFMNITLNNVFSCWVAITPGLTCVLGFPVLAYFGKKFPNLLDDPRLPLPSCLLLFLLHQAIDLTKFVMIFIHENFHFAQKVKTLTDVWNILSFSSFLFLNSTFNLIIGVSASKICRNIDNVKAIRLDTEHLAEGRRLYHEFKSLKNALSPILFIKLVSEVSVVLIYFYYLFLPTQEMFHVSKKMIITSASQVIINLTYICLVLGDAHTTFVSFAQQLRFVYLSFFTRVGERTLNIHVWTSSILGLCNTVLVLFISNHFNNHDFLIQRKC